jgi:hypothetical protein
VFNATDTTSARPARHGNVDGNVTSFYHVRLTCDFISLALSHQMKPPLSPCFQQHVIEATAQILKLVSFLTPPSPTTSTSYIYFPYPFCYHYLILHTTHCPTTLPIAHYGAR